ncbi:MAG: GGDEF domain-containing protein [Pontibacterium sp.]
MSEHSGLAVMHLDALVSALDESVLFLNKEGCVISYSTGDNDWIHPSGLAGRPVAELFPASPEPYFPDLLSKAVAGGVQRLELLVRPDNAPVLKAAGLVEPLWLSLTVATAGDGWVIVLKDVSEQKRQSRKSGGRSQRDILTGAYNRRTLMPVISQAVAQAQRYDWICSILVIEIDGLATINQQHGWDTGDQILQQMVRELDKLKRTADFLARISGDQLTLFLPETNREQALLAAQRVLKLASEMPVLAGSQQISFTVSIGASTLGDVEDSADQMLERAEDNLALAIHSGGNCAQGEDI